MGLYSNTVSIRQYHVDGDIPEKSQLFAWACAGLNGRRFNAIEHSAEELSEGWVPTDSPEGGLFESPEQCWRDRYLFFTYRRDQRRIPALILKSHIRQAEEAYLQERPELVRPPKRQREEIKERIVSSLLVKTLPSPAMVDVCWQMDEGILSIFSSSKTACERVESLFCKSFSACKLIPIYPWRRALSLLEGEQLERFSALNQAGTGAVLDEMQANGWLGREFLEWLLEQGLEGDGFSVRAPGHTGPGTTFSAWVDDKITLVGGSDAGLQKVVVSGVQDRYLEARSALVAGKSIERARINLEMGELVWNGILDADEFSLQSFRCPPVSRDHDAGDRQLEQEGLFLERMYLLENGLQLFDSLLVQYISCRLDTTWNQWQEQYRTWLHGEQA